MLLQVGVKAFLRNSNGKYLLLKRSRKKYPQMAGLWDIVGGRIIPGTPLFENLKREIDEETNLTLKKQPRLIDATDILRVKELHVVRLTYIGEIEGDVVVDKSEIDDYKWLTIDEIKAHEDLDIYTKDLLSRMPI